MTMLRAIVLLLASGALMVAGVVLVFLRVDGGLVNAEIKQRDVGARIGDERATPTGAFEDIFSGTPGSQLDDDFATVTAIVRTAEAHLTPTPGPAISEPTGIGGSVSYDGARYTVLQVVDPEPPGFFSTKEGHRRVAIELRMEAMGKPLRYAFSNFKVRDTSGVDYGWAITNSEPRFGNGSLTQGESRQGWIAFDLPEGAQPAALMLNVLGRREGILLVTLQ